MRIGLSTPVVVQFPGACSDWERGGDIDGLVSVAVTADELGFGVGVGSLREKSEMLGASWEVALAPTRPLDPLGDPDGTRGRLRALREVGATVVTAAVSAESCDHYCDQLGMLRKLADTIS